MRRTIRSSREIDAMFRSGERAATKTLVLLAERTPEQRGPLGRVAFVAGRRIGPAVTRNRAKRVMRSAVRRAGGPWPGWDVVIIARAETAIASPGELDAALDQALSRVGVVAP